MAVMKLSKRFNNRGLEMFNIQNKNDEITAILRLNLFRIKCLNKIKVLN